MGPFKKFSEEIASEISKISNMEVDAVLDIINPRLGRFLDEFLTSKSSVAEREYYEMLKKQSKNKIGSSEYISTAFKLSQLKYQKVLANRALNNVKREQKFDKLVAFVTENCGERVMEEFYKENPNE